MKLLKATNPNRKPMELEGTSFSAVTPEELLGRPLNDIETKYAPRTLYVSGSMDIPLPRPRVSIVGSRNASEQARTTAAIIAKTLVSRGVVIVSGLAKGIDTAGHESAISTGGRTIAVLGTPLDKTYPAQNYNLQQEIMRHHLAVSEFPSGRPTRPNNFVLRNRTMALISDASIIVEAGEKSGSLHQGWEALRLGRSLFIWTTVVNNPRLSWPAEMLKYGAMELNDPNEVLEVLPSSMKMLNVFS
jgi:DNA processing protein